MAHRLPPSALYQATAIPWGSPTRCAAGLGPRATSAGALGTFNSPKAMQLLPWHWGVPAFPPGRGVVAKYTKRAGAPRRPNVTLSARPGPDAITRGTVHQRSPQVAGSDARTRNGNAFTLQDLPPSEEAPTIAKVQNGGGAPG
jgi:hypothetical protein